MDESRGVGGLALKGIKNVGHGVKSAGKGVRNVAQTGVSTVGHGVKSAGKGVRNVAQTGVSTVGHGVLEVGKGVGHVGKGVGKGVVNVAGTGVKGVVNVAGTGVKGVVNAGKNVVQGAKHLVDHDGEGGEPQEITTLDFDSDEDELFNMEVSRDDKGRPLRNWNPNWSYKDFDTNQDEDSSDEELLHRAAEDSDSSEEFFPSTPSNKKKKKKGMCDSPNSSSSSEMFLEEGTPQQKPKRSSLEQVVTTPSPKARRAPAQINSSVLVNALKQKQNEMKKSSSAGALSPKHKAGGMLRRFSGGALADKKQSLRRQNSGGTQGSKKKVERRHSGGALNDKKKALRAKKAKEAAEDGDDASGYGSDGALKNAKAKRRSTSALKAKKKDLAKVKKAAGTASDVESGYASDGVLKKKRKKKKKDDMSVGGKSTRTAASRASTKKKNGKKKKKGEIGMSIHSKSSKKSKAGSKAGSKVGATGKKGKRVSKKTLDRQKSENMKNTIEQSESAEADDPSPPLEISITGPSTLGKNSDKTDDTSDNSSINSQTERLFGDEGELSSAEGATSSANPIENGEATEETPKKSMNGFGALALGMVNKVQDTATATAGKVKNTATATAGKVKDTASAAANTVADTTSKTVHAVGDKTSKAVHAVADTTSKTASAVGGTATKAATAVGTTAAKPANAFLAKLQANKRSSENGSAPNTPGKKSPLLGKGKPSLLLAKLRAAKAPPELTVTTEESKQSDENASGEEEGNEDEANESADKAGNMRSQLMSPGKSTFSARDVSRVTSNGSAWNKLRMSAHFIGSAKKGASFSALFDKKEMEVMEKEDKEIEEAAGKTRDEIEAEKQRRERQKNADMDKKWQEIEDMERNLAAEREKMAKERESISFQRESLELQLEEEVQKNETLTHKLEELEEEIRIMEAAEAFMDEDEEGMITEDELEEFEREPTPMEILLAENDSLKLSLEKQKRDTVAMLNEREGEIQKLRNEIDDLRDVNEPEDFKIIPGEKSRERLQGELLQAVTKLQMREALVERQHWENAEMKKELEQLRGGAQVQGLKEKIATMETERRELEAKFEAERKATEEKLKEKEESVAFFLAELSKVKQELAEAQRANVLPFAAPAKKEDAAAPPDLVSTASTLLSKFSAPETVPGAFNSTQHQQQEESPVRFSFVPKSDRQPLPDEDEELSVGSLGNNPALDPLLLAAEQEAKRAKQLQAEQAKVKAPSSWGSMFSGYT